MKKGATSTVLLWALGIMATVSLALYKQTFDVQNIHAQQINNLTSQVSTATANETNLNSTVTSINAKVDILLEDNGYTKARIQSLINQKQ